MRSSIVAEPSEPRRRGALHGPLLVVVVTAVAVMGLVHGVLPLLLGEQDNDSLAGGTSLTVILVWSLMNQETRVRSWAYWRDLMIATFSLVAGWLLVTNLVPLPSKPSWLMATAYSALKSAVPILLFLVVMEYRTRLGVRRILLLVGLLSAIDAVILNLFRMMY